jgi:hypothetical protein
MGAVCRGRFQLRVKGDAAFQLAQNSVRELVTSCVCLEEVTDNALAGLYVGKDTAEVWNRFKVDLQQFQIRLGQALGSVSVMAAACQNCMVHEVVCHAVMQSGGTDRWSQFLEQSVMYGGSQEQYHWVRPAGWELRWAARRVERMGGCWNAVKACLAQLPDGSWTADTLTPLMMQWQILGKIVTWLQQQLLRVGVQMQRVRDEGLPEPLHRADDSSSDGEWTLVEGGALEDQDCYWLTA